MFANFEQTRLDSSSVITIAPESVAAVNALLDAVAYAGPRIATGLFATGYESSNALLRIDQQLDGKGLLSARYSLYDVQSPNARNVGGLNALSRGTALGNRDQTLAVNLLATLSARTVNETRLQYTRSRLAAPPNDIVGPAVNVAGTASFGTATFSPTVRAIDVYEVANVTTTVRGAHAVKWGVDLLWNRLDIAFPGAIQGVYTFASLAAFTTGPYVTFQQAFGAEGQFQSNPNLGLFVQDEWRVRRDLTLNLGLRYDLQFLPDPVRTDADDVSPRLGVAWAPGNGRTVVRASAGIYYVRIPLRATSNALQRDGTKYRVAVLAFGQPGGPVFPATLGALPSGLLPSVTIIDPGIDDGYDVQTSLQVERQIGQGTSISVGYLRNRGHGIVMQRNLNVPTLSAAQATALGIPNLGRPRPGYGNVFFFTPQDNFDPGDDKGRSDNDQRHRLVVSGTLEVPSGAAGAPWWRRSAAGFRLGYLYSYGSALPFNVVTGADRNNDTNVNDRPPGVGRNTGQGFGFSSLDLRLSRLVGVGSRARLEVMLEAFNVLNRPNYQLPNNVYGTGMVPRTGFGQPTAAADPRQIQLGLRASF